VLDHLAVDEVVGRLVHRPDRGEDMIDIPTVKLAWRAMPG